MKKKISTILCPVDFSRFSPHVIAWGQMLAKSFAARLVIFNAVPPQRERLFPSKRIHQKKHIRDARAAIEKLMENCPVQWEATVLPGDPVAEASRVAEEYEADLVIVASHGFSGFKRVFLGSVVEKMAREIARPLLVLRWHSTPSDEPEGSITAFQRVMTACDLKPYSVAAAEYGLLFARQFNSSLSLVHTVSSPAQAEEGTIDGAYSVLQENLRSGIKERLISSLPPGDAPLKEGDDAFLNCTGNVLIGSPGEEIPFFAKKDGADLVVVGVRHRTAIGKLLTGSTTESIIRSAPCHVLAVPEKVGESGGRESDGRMAVTGVVLDPRYLEHETPHGHPESKKRLEPLFDLVTTLEGSLPMTRIEPRYASKEEVGLVHSSEYVNRIENTRKKAYTALNPDTHMCDKSYETALLAVGGVLEGLDHLFNNHINNALILARPPGHHAEKNRAMGFCIFNNVAIGAAYAKKKFGVSRVLIVDWDVHHGNGTQHIFEHDPSVLFFSTHQQHHYPGSGSFSEAGLGPGEGYTVNIPIPKGYGDGEYAAIYTRVLSPLTRAFAPDLILVSAGFDIHQSDFLGGMALTSPGFANLTRAVMDMAQENKAKLMLTLEGGYHTQSFAVSVVAVLKELAGKTRSNPVLTAKRADTKKVGYVMDRCVHVHKEFWECWRNHAG